MTSDTDLILPEVPNWADPVWHLFVIRHPRRNELQQSLAEAKIGTLIHYPIPPHHQKAYADMGYQKDAYPLASSLADDMLSIPIGPHMASEEQDFVIQELKNRFTN